MEAKPLRIHRRLRDKVIQGIKVITRRPVMPPPTINPNPSCPYKAGETRYFVSGRRTVVLYVESIRMERLHDMQPEDLRKEGVTVDGRLRDVPADAYELMLERYKRYWGAIYKSEPFRFEDNPWVWVIHFRLGRIERRKRKRS